MSIKAISVPDLPSKITGVIWDGNLPDRDVFIVFNENEIITYAYVKNSIYGKLENRRNFRKILLIR